MNKITEILIKNSKKLDFNVNGEKTKAMQIMESET